MDERRLRQILAEEIEKTVALDAKPSAAEHIAKIRDGELTPGLQGALNAMRRAVEEDRDPLA
jgi:hypothetical protein